MTSNRSLPSMLTYDVWEWHGNVLTLKRFAWNVFRNEASIQMFKKRNVGGKIIIIQYLLYAFIH